MKFELQKGRAENIMLESPFPGERRFEWFDVHENNFDLPPLNLDVRA